MSNIPTLKIARISYLIGGILLIAFVPAAGFLFSKPVPHEFTSLYLGIMFTVLGLPGILYLARREAPSRGLTTTKGGLSAVLSGVATIVFFLLPGIILLCLFVALFFGLLK